MSDLLLPRGLAVKKAVELRAKAQAEAAAEFAAKLDTAIRNPLAALGVEDQGKLTGDVVYPHDMEIPAKVPRPGQWRVALFPVCQRQKFRNSSLYVAPETLDTQNWTHPLWKVAAVGPFIYRGPAWHGFPEEDLAEARRDLVPGALFLVDAKQPRRFYLDGVLFIVVNDDQLWMGPIEPETTERMTFKGEGL